VKIAAIVGGFPKLSETFILRQLTGLVDLGHEVDIYARRNPREAAVQPEVLRYGFLRRTSYFELPPGRWARARRALRALAAILRRRPRAALACVSLGRPRGLYAILNNLIFVEPFLDRPYDAVVCYWGGNGMDFVVLKEVFPRLRFVTRFGGDDYAIGDEQGPEALAHLRHLGDAFMVQTDCYGRATLRRYGFDDARIVTFRHIINPREVTFRERVRDGGPVEILTVARLVEKKGIRVALQALADLRARRPDLALRYRVIGDGPLAEPLRDLVSRLGLRDVVEFAGARPTPEVMKAMDRAHLYLLPSLMEQAGYVLLEAQASGLPIIATRVGGVPEMVQEGRSAILVPPGDAAAVSGALERLASRPETWPEMGRAGREHVELHHDSEKLQTRLAAILAGEPA
jgi:colanic acid/amylovoran biosynthesis glycosyltransferase